MRVIYVLPLLLLTACGYESPTWMPMGYSYHNDEYKAQPGPEADNLGYDYTEARNDHIVATWRSIASDLITELEQKTGMSPQPVYIEQLPDVNAFNLSLDNALREEFVARGYTLVETAEGGGTHLKYQAFDVGDEKKRPAVVYNGDEDVLTKPYDPEKRREFVFVLTALQDGAAFSEVRAKRNIPAYGYVHGEGTTVPATRIFEGNEPVGTEEPTESLNN
jgi:hypothetical protein